MTSAIFAVPGQIDRPTGGYEYARQLISHAAAAGLELWHWPLPAGFPDPDHDDLWEARRRLSMGPNGWPIIIDGLALGAMPSEILAELDAPVIALCHHPLAMETGLAPARAEELRSLETEALALCDAVITTSQATAGHLAHEYRVPEGRITVARPGIASAPRSTGSGSGTVEILSVGSLIPRKGHHLLIDALSGLTQHRWHLRIVGAADAASGCSEDLTQQVAAYGLSDRVELAGPHSRDALTRSYMAADLFVLASLHEGFGMAYVEAMAHGLPVVSSRLDAVGEATRGAARLVPPGDVTALRGALDSLLTSRDARMSLAESCWTAAKGFGRWDETAKIIAGVLTGVAKPRRAWPTAVS